MKPHGQKSNAAWIIGAIAMGLLWLAPSPQTAHAQKGKSLSTRTFKKLASCALSYQPSSWYFSSLRTVLVKQRAFGIYRSGWRSLTYAIRIPNCISRVKGNRSYLRMGIGSLTAISGLPVYSSQQGGQKHSYRVNYYNPALFQWLANNLPSNQVSVLGVKTQALYKTMFRRFVRITAYTYLHLRQVGFSSLVKQYERTHLTKQPLKGRARWAQRSRARAVRRRMQKRFQKLVMDPVMKGPNGRIRSYYYNAGHAAMFWMRRGVDGTHKDVWQLLKAVLKEYDPNFLSSVRNPSKPITLKLPKLPPPKTYVFGPGQTAQIQSAIAKASPYSRIKLKAGTYRYNSALQISGKSFLTIEGAGQGKTRIVVDNRSSDVISIRSSQNITLKGVSARHTNPPKGMTCTGAVVSVGRSKKVWLHDNELNGSGAYGVRAWGTQDLVITRNFIHSNTNAAFQIGGSRGVHIEKNIIKNNASTLLCYYGCGINIMNNTIGNNKGYTNRSAFYRSLQSRIKQQP